MRMKGRGSKALEVGRGVRRNYEAGHGLGRLVRVHDDRNARFAREVIWDSGVGPEPYTYNAETKEIVPA